MDVLSPSRSHGRMPSQVMGAREERTWEAICGNHKPSQLGVKCRGRSNVSLTSPYKLSMSTHKKEKLSGTLETKHQSWEGGGQHGHGSFTGTAGAVFPSVPTLPPSVPITSAVMALRLPKAQQFAPFSLQTQALLRGTCLSQIWKISAKRTAKDLT